ncbi:MAG TPA: DUF6748 domain-containing protein [Polyangiaceae bacterium]
MKASRSWMKLGWLSAVALFSVGASASHAPGSGSRTGSPARTPTIADAYGFYFAVTAGSGYIVSGVNGATVPCTNGTLATACYVSGIDFGPMSLGDAASRAILKDVGSDPNVAKLIFGGKVAAGALEVWEAWRAPLAISTSRQLYGVSHDNEQALVVNQWTASSLGTMDFTSAPLMAPCAPNSGCAATLDEAEVQAQTPVGVLVAGTPERGGQFRVDHYFLYVSTGIVQTGDGYSYCTAEQSVCYNGVCSNGDGCNALHGRIRGLADPPKISPDVTFQQWQLATGQLWASDLANGD